MTLIIYDVGSKDLAFRISKFFCENAGSFHRPIVNWDMVYLREMRKKYRKYQNYCSVFEHVVDLSFFEFKMKFQDVVLLKMSKLFGYNAILLSSGDERIVTCGKVEVVYRRVEESPLAWIACCEPGRNAFACAIFAKMNQFDRENEKVYMPVKLFIALPDERKAGFIDYIWGSCVSMNVWNRSELVFDPRRMMAQGRMRSRSRTKHGLAVSRR